MEFGADMREGGVDHWGEAARGPWFTSRNAAHFRWNSEAA